MTVPWFAARAVPPLDAAIGGGNTPVFDALGRRVWLRECWRIPARPFRAPTCCGKVTRRIGRNVYRCGSCAARIEPERLWHRLMLWRNPFRRDEAHPFRTLFHVTCWAADSHPRSDTTREETQ